jgi:integrase/recombinase XerD
VVSSRLRVVEGGAVSRGPVAADPWEYQAECVDAFVTSWRARGFSPVTIDNDTGLLERTLKALGLPAWEVTPTTTSGAWTWPRSSSCSVTGR